MRDPAVDVLPIRFRDDNGCIPVISYEYVQDPATHLSDKVAFTLGRSVQGSLFCDIQYGVNPRQYFLDLESGLPAVCAAGLPVTKEAEK